MTKTELLRRVRGRLRGLSEEHLRVADHFLAWLQECEGDDETAGLLSIPGFARELQEAERDIEAGRLTPVEDLKRKY